MPDDEKYLAVIPSHIRSELTILLRNSLSLRERWEIAKEKAEAQGKVNMVIADFLIREGLMKRRLPKR